MNMVSRYGVSVKKVTMSSGAEFAFETTYLEEDHPVTRVYLTTPYNRIHFAGTVLHVDGERRFIQTAHMDFAFSSEALAVLSAFAGGDMDGKIRQDHVYRVKDMTVTVVQEGTDGDNT